MGSEWNPGKPRYDVTMSKRTRKPLNLPETNYKGLDNGEGFPDKGGGGEDFPGNIVAGEGRSNHPKNLKLKQLIHTEEIMARNSNDSNNISGRSSLGQHFSEEEKQLQLVRKHTKSQGLPALKLKGLMGHYFKVLGHMIKIKPHSYRTSNSIPSQKKPNLPFPM